MEENIVLRKRKHRTPKDKLVEGVEGDLCVSFHLLCIDCQYNKLSLEGVEGKKLKFLEFRI